MARKSQFGGISSSLKDSLGVNKDNFPTTVLTPPPKYPPLLGRPSPLVLSTDQEYMLAIGKELFRSLRSFDHKDILMEHLPSELSRKRSLGKNKISNGNCKQKKPRTTLSLEALESMEDKDDLEDDEEGGEEKEKKKKAAGDEDEPEEDVGSGDDADEELDEGTDYANNYFDNGEDYGDNEDDNLDEGGIY